MYIAFFKIKIFEFIWEKRPLTVLNVTTTKLKSKRSYGEKSYFKIIICSILFINYKIDYILITYQSVYTYLK